MRIVKVGYSHYDDEKEFKCPRCACEFLAGAKDFRDSNNKIIKDPGTSNINVANVQCPWCKEKIATIL